MSRSSTNRALSGPEKAVVVLLSIREEISSEIIKHLDSSELTKISNYVNLLAEVPRERVLAIKEEFTDCLADATGGLTSAGRGRMRDLMSKSLDGEKLDEVMEVLDSGSSSIGLETLRWLEPQAIASFIRNEHPQTIALILSHLESSQAAQVLSLIGEAQQSEVVMRIANLESISPDVVRDLNEILAKELTQSGAARNQSIGGIEAVAEIVNSLDKTSEAQIMGKVEESNPTLAESIRALMFVFEDLVKVDDRSMQNIMKEVSNDILTLALKTASDDLRDKMFRSISSRAAQMIEEELEIMGPVRLSDVENAQNEIVKIARRLEEEGKIVIGAGGGEEFV